MTCEYTKTEVKKNDTTAITTTANKTCIGRLDENWYLMGKERQF